ncbi:hypothetical protein [Kitasatospora fiedleri]|uniref:hypothetical protein n=1 Tax=Kitasatospora fiedleri TaxID=2991545 RepID=UPI00249CBF1F|nr:hypothetical protein [Kitasatospora fiedleri]
MKDSFGVDIEPGDYILSASTTHGRVKVGRARAGQYGRLSMEIGVSAQHGRQEEKHPKAGQLGHNVVVLRKADGTVPVHVAGPGNWLTVDGELLGAVVEVEAVTDTETYWEYRVRTAREPGDAGE